MMKLLDGIESVAEKQITKHNTMAKLQKSTKTQNLSLDQPRRNHSWIELRTDSPGRLHRFGAIIGFVHHISNELGITGMNGF
jgi:hypothetical protein